MPKIAIFHVGVVAVLEKTEAAGFGGDIKIIEVQTGVFKREAAAPNFISALLLPVGQEKGLIMIAIFLLEQTFYLGGVDGGGNMDIQRAKLPRHECTEGGFELRLFAVE